MSGGDVDGPREHSGGFVPGTITIGAGEKMREHEPVDARLGRFCSGFGCREVRELAGLVLGECGLAQNEVDVTTERRQRPCRPGV